MNISNPVREDVVSGPMDVLSAGGQVSGVHRGHLGVGGWEDHGEIYATICPEVDQTAKFARRG